MIIGALRFIKRFQEGYKRGQLRQYIAIFKRLCIMHRRKLYIDFFSETDQLILPDSSRYEISRNLINGLHELLSKDNKIRFSVRIDGQSEKTLQSVKLQTAKEVDLFEKDPKGSHVLFLRAGDYIRIDFLYRYEQILRLLDDPNTVLFIGTEILNFPYEFELKDLPALLVPVHFYESIKDLDPFLRQLKLDSLGAKFLAVDSKIFETDVEVKYPEPLPYFQQYGKWKNLGWTYETGLIKGSVRGSPPLVRRPTIQVIIPFKDQKELTLKAVDAALKSEGVDLEITCVDNRSLDLTITTELENRGVKVLRVDEPFNYSRLNNIAAATSQTELICFLNNDAIIEPQAILEMAKWALQPSIGLVGARLLYPSGHLQHGGVKLDLENGYKRNMSWVHIELNLKDEALNRAKTIHIADGVTAAFSLVKRSLFNEVKGFDERFYPVAYSDTNLGQKLQKIGYLSLYTPYAKGIHHESVSRKVSPVENFDNSVFWDRIVQQHWK